MELGEKVSVDMIIDEQHDEETCAFCTASEPPKEAVNTLTDDFDEDAEAKSGDTAASYTFKNDSGELGRSLGGRPDAKKVALNGKEFDAVAAAHHLIPGNASLKKSTLFKSGKFLWKDGKAKGNIGYNINAAENGVWSPGNYGVRPWGPKGKTFSVGQGVDPEEFAFGAIDAWGAQFHDAHGHYSKFVKDALDKLHKKLKAQEDIWCPEAKKKEKAPDEKEPLYILVSRLNTISGRMKKMLVFPTTNWKRNIYTSSYCEAYMDNRPHAKK